jgi:protocatechuate 3,4-dioxygenase beta subunit
MTKANARTRAGAGIVAGLALAAFAGTGWARGTPAPGKPAPAPAKPVRAAVTGFAKDEAGKPVAGAEAVAVHATEKGVWKARTDAKGAFLIPGVPAGEATVVVRARSRVPFEKKVEVPASGTVSCDATLALGVRFAGKVVDMRDAPVRGAVVEAVPADESGRLLPFSAADPVESKADGTFVADGLRAGGSYTLRVRHPRHADVELPELAAEAGAGHEGLEVVMEDAAWVSGVVVDASGKPVPTARVRVGGDDGAVGAPEWIRSFLAGRGVIVSFSSSEDDGDPVDAQGRFEVGGLVEPEVELSAIADGYFRTKWTVEGLEAGKGTENVRIALEAATAWVEGRVVDAEGKGLSGVEVTASGDLGVAGTATTDAIGAFRLARLRSRSAVTLVAEAEGRAKARKTEVSLDSGGVTLTLHKSPRVRGRIVDASGRLVPKVHLSIRSKVEDHTEFHSSFVDQTEKGFDVAVPIGDVVVEASTPDGLAGRVGEWTTEPAGVVDAGTVTLEGKARGPRPGGDDEGGGEDEGDDEEE